MATQQTDSGGPIDEGFAVRLAATVGIDLPDMCVAGVVANLGLLADHAARLDAALDEMGSAA